MSIECDGIWPEKSNVSASPTFYHRCIVVFYHPSKDVLQETLEFSLPVIGKISDSSDSETPLEVCALMLFKSLAIRSRGSQSGRGTFPGGHVCSIKEEEKEREGK